MLGGSQILPMQILSEDKGTPFTKPWRKMFDFTILYLAKWLFMQLQNAFYNTSVIS